MNKLERVFDLYSYLFARKKFYRLNKALFHLSLRGLGILNFKDDAASGEEQFLRVRLQGTVRPVVLDVGANVGNYSAAVLNAKPDAQVYSFEPHPGAFKGLSERLTPRGVQTINAACGKTAGQLILYDYMAAGSEHASFYKGVIEQLHHREAQGHQVDVIDLDTFVSERNLEHIDLLKIDTEGHELEVLSGATRTLRSRKIEAIQFEFNEMNLISRTFLRDFYTALPQYSLHRMVRDGLVPLGEQPVALGEIFAFQNIVALLRPNPPN